MGSSVVADLGVLPGSSASVPALAGGAERPRRPDKDEVPGSSPGRPTSTNGTRHPGRNLVCQRFARRPRNVPLTEDRLFQ
jgi:hypothetical protein